jgi:threonine aldolase
MQPLLRPSISPMNRIISRAFSAARPRVDLRSDTITKPSEGMFRAMLSAPLGDDVFREDPTVKLLEETLAARFNKPSGLFLPTGTMSNLAAILAHCDSRGAEIITGTRKGDAS